MSAETLVPVTRTGKPSILFVDDEHNILEGIRRNYRSLRAEYDMLFAESGQEALALLDQQTVDIVVSDMRMPMMDGATLLQEVARAHPETVRIILTGHSDEELILKAVPVTHRFLSKPCSSDDLKQSIDRIILFRDSLHSRSISRFLSGIGRLPVLPMSLQKLQQEIASDNASIERVAEMISQDPSLTARILQMANSAFFGPRQALSSPVDATRYLGLETVGALALHVHLFHSIDQTASVGGRILTELQNRSTHVADIAHRITLDLGGPEEEAKDAFAGGLLSEIGRLVLALSPAISRQAESTPVGEPENGGKEETIPVEISHAEIGAYLLVLWGIPPTLVNIVSSHHRPAEMGDKPLVPVIAVHVAQSLLDIIYKQSKPPAMDWVYLSAHGFTERMPEWLRYALTCCGLPEDSWSGLLAAPVNEQQWNPAS